MKLVSRLLKKLGYSLQANRKRLEGAQHPDRNAQFENINELIRLRLEANEPVISVDTKKRNWLVRTRTAVLNSEPTVIGRTPVVLVQITKNRRGWTPPKTDGYLWHVLCLAQPPRSRRLTHGNRRRVLVVRIADAQALLQAGPLALHQRRTRPDRSPQVSRDRRCSSSVFSCSMIELLAQSIQHPLVPQCTRSDPRTLHGYRGAGVISNSSSNCRRHPLETEAAVLLVHHGPGPIE